MKLAILFGSSPENVPRLKPVLTLFGLACLVIGIAGAEPATNLFGPAAKGPKNTVVATIPCGSNPYDIVVSPDNKTVYVASRGSNTVVVINTATNTVTASIPVGNTPNGIAITPDGTKVYVTNFLGDSVSVIDTATNLVSATVDLQAEEPAYLTVSPDGTSVYVAQVEVFDLAENKVVKKILLPSTVESILKGAVTPNGKYLYLPAGFTETVVMVDLVTNRYVESFQAGSEPTAVAIAPNGNYAYVADGSEDASAVTVVDISEQ